MRSDMIIRFLPGQLRVNINNLRGAPGLYSSSKSFKSLSINEHLLQIDRKKESTQHVQGADSTDFLALRYSSTQVNIYATYQASYERVNSSKDKELRHRYVLTSAPPETSGDGIRNPFRLTPGSEG